MIVLTVLGLGCSPWRQDRLTERPRQPGELFGCQQRRHQPVHWVMGFSCQFLSIRSVEFFANPFLSLQLKVWAW